MSNLVIANEIIITFAIRIAIRIAMELDLVQGEREKIAKSRLATSECKSKI